MKRVRTDGKVDALILGLATLTSVAFQDGSLSMTNMSLTGRDRS